MNNIKPYTKYKPSGIAWLGDIPAHWEARKLKFLLKLQKGKNPANFTTEDISLPYLSMEYLRDKTKIKSFVLPQENLVEVNEGDLLVLWDGANAGEIIKSKHGFLSSTMAVIKPNEDFFDKNYFYQFLKGLEKEFKDFSNGTTIPHFDSDILLNNHYCIPPIPEQTAIASFLDYKTAKIDRFIFKKKQLIKLLNEQKAGIINHAVTKGINPDTKNKPSGIEWLGDIPEHWEVSRMKNICSVRQGLQIPISERLSEEFDNCLEYITIKSINNPDNHREYILNPSKNVICQVEDILVVRTGGTGHIITNVKGVFHNNFFLVDYDRKKVEKEFLYYYLVSPKIRTYLLLVAGTTTIPDLNHGEFYNTPFFEFDKREQAAIVSHIEKETAKLNQAIATIEKEITLVQEYRTALIAEAVTGKIDVTNYEIGIIDGELEDIESIELAEEQEIEPEDNNP